MSKKQLVLSDSDRVSFDTPWINDLIRTYFDVVFIEHEPVIKSDALFATRCNDTSNWYVPFLEKERKLIVDNLWEIPVSRDTGFVVSNQNWFWYNESLWYRHLGYHNFVAEPAIQKNGLLLINGQKTHRDWLFDKLNLEKLLYSYVDRGIRIRGDIDIHDNRWQRYFNPMWYNSTAFSIVAETTVWRDEPLFITEKTFKPIAFQHPFIVFGQTGLLTYIRELGFETFENIFDESYDAEHEVDTRLASIVNQINSYTHMQHDLVTLEKLKHNKELFFNEQLVKNNIINEIINPILEYAET